MAETGASLGFRTLACGLLATGETVVMLNNVSLDSDDMEATALQMLDSMVRQRGS